MFFVTLLLNELVGWMRTQTGTTSLRAMLYMDEVFGYMPPVANPPSKPPLLTLLKQARAFGVGVVLATQNPVDLDYKGLCNTGTWFLGRLQTERDKARVLDGLEGAMTGAAGFDRARMAQMLSGARQAHLSHAQRPRRWSGGLRDTLDDVLSAGAADEGSDPNADDSVESVQRQRPERALPRSPRGSLRLPPNARAVQRQHRVRSCRRTSRSISCLLEETPCTTSRDCGRLRRSNSQTRSSTFERVGPCRCSHRLRAARWASTGTGRRQPTSILADLESEPSSSATLGTAGRGDPFEELSRLEE